MANDSTILTEYLFKENARKDKKCMKADENDIIDRKVLSVKELDEMHQAKAKNREMKRSYLSTLSTKFNPDILMGSAGNGNKNQFLKGNEYFSKAHKENDDEQS